VGDSPVSHVTAEKDYHLPLSPISFGSIITNNFKGDFINSFKIQGYMLDQFFTWGWVLFGSFTHF
jgi:hypothetical protein